MYESYVPTKKFREKRSLVRHRISLVRNRTILENKVHSLLDKYDYKSDLTIDVDLLNQRFPEYPFGLLPWGGFAESLLPTHDCYVVTAKTIASSITVIAERKNQRIVSVEALVSRLADISSAERVL